jgi:predicted ATP-dependent serine protease
MSNTEHYRCPRCGAYSRQFGYCTECKADTQPKNQSTAELLTIYTELRSSGIALECLIDKPGSLTTEDLKRLDKAVTVMKVGFKIVKKVLRTRGIEGCLTPAEEPGSAPTE